MEEDQEEFDFILEIEQAQIDEILTSLPEYDAYLS